MGEWLLHIVELRANFFQLSPRKSSGFGSTATKSHDLYNRSIPQSTVCNGTSSRSFDAENLG
jgi:hypothetical protein